MEGDTIVMGSDGLFDNVFDHEIVSTVAGHGDVAAAGMSSKIRRTCIWQSTSHFSNWDLISMLAKALANLASIHSTNSEFESPYSLEARSKVTLFGMITVLLSIKSSFQRVWCFFFFVNAPDRDLMFLSGRKFLAWSSLVKTYKDGTFSSIPQVTKFFVWQVGNLMISLWLLVRLWGHNISPCWLRIRQLKLIQNKKINSNHSYKTLCSLFLDCLVKFRML